MSIERRIQTVLGDIKPCNLGVTMTHEHLSLDYSIAFIPPEERFKQVKSLPFTLPNLGLIRQHPYSHEFNLIMNDENDTIVEELKLYKLNGGCSIVENTTNGIHRDVAFLKDLATQTGVNIIAGAGYYVDSSHPSNMDSKDIEAITKEIVAEMTVGCDGTDIKAGVIGEIGCSWPLTANERRVLKSTAHAQLELGCPVIIHPGRHTEAPTEIIRLLQESGCDITKTVMSHLDRTIHKDDELLEFAGLGSYCEYDLFGIEVSDYQFSDIDMPNDAERIRRIQLLVKEGYGDKVVIAHDMHTKHRLTKFGGHGYSHILMNVVPKMLKRGLSKDDVDKILIGNPREFLAF